MARFYLGEALQEVAKALALYSNVISKMKQDVPMCWCRIFLQGARNLQGQASSDPCQLTGDTMDEAITLPDLLQRRELTGICASCYLKMLISCLLQRHQQTLDFLEATEPYLTGVMSVFVMPRIRFFESLARLGLCPAATRAQRRRHLRKVAVNQRQLKRWARYAPSNHLHVYELVEAERCRVLGRFTRAKLHYEQAISAAKEGGFPHEEALAHELAGRYYLERAAVRTATEHLQTARRGYLNWGAKLKVEHLDETYPTELALPRKHTTDRARGLATGTQMATPIVSTDSLDLGSVIKASQSISQEVVQGQLLDRLMKIVVQNAGADRGALVLRREEELWVEALLDIHVSQETRITSVPLDRCEQVPAVIIRLVAHTGENAVLGDASLRGEFARDPYVAWMQPKSILCIPILRHGALIGVLYLENSATADAFTPARVDMLSLLAAQSAISLDNARLYEQLKDALARAQESDRLKTEFLARASHELRTPLNPIINAPDEIIDQLAPRLIARCKGCGSTYQYEEGDVFNAGTACPSCQAKGSLEKQEAVLEPAELEELLKLARMITKGGKQLYGVVNDILDFSKLELGKLRLKMERVPVGEVVEEVCEMMQAEAEKQHVQIVHPALSPESDMDVDPLRLKQILYNLIGNAIKFSRAEGGTVELGVELDQDSLLLSVRDEGIGIAQENQQIIFESFRQVEGVAMRKHSGSGLGLAIVKMLVEGHHGEISVTSEPGRGSTFTVRLPRWQGPRPHQDPGNKE